MKLPILVILLTAAFPSYSQIQVLELPKETVIGKIKSGGITHAELSYTSEDSDTTFRLIFRNVEYEYAVDYVIVTFSNEGGILDTLYSILKSFFSEENKKKKDYAVNLKLGNTDVLLKSRRSMGISGVMIYTDKGYTVVGSKQIDKLFNK